MILFGAFKLGQIHHVYFGFIRLIAPLHEDTSEDAFANPVVRQCGSACFKVFS